MQYLHSLKLPASSPLKIAHHMLVASLIPELGVTCTSSFSASQIKTKLPTLPTTTPPNITWVVVKRCTQHTPSQHLNHDFNLTVKNQCHACYTRLLRNSTWDFGIMLQICVNHKTRSDLAGFYSPHVLWIQNRSVTIFCQQPIWIYDSLYIFSVAITCLLSIYERIFKQSQKIKTGIIFEEILNHWAPGNMHHQIPQQPSLDASR